MRYLDTLLLLLFPISLPLMAQEAAAPPAAQASAPVPTASSILSPALVQVGTAIGSVRVEKWKTSGAVRDAADNNLNSIRTDLDTTLPPLLAEADGAPGSVAKIFPAYRNIDALYDVLLRVAQTAELAAPSSQTDDLEHALSSIEDGRHRLADVIQNAALAQDQQVATLTAQLKAAQTQPPAPTAPAKPAPTHHHKIKTTPPPQ